jgi:GH18 family chitinase
VTQPYFGPQETGLFKSLGYDLTKDTYVKYNDIVKKLNDPQKRFTEHWDDQAKVPWLSVNSAGGKALFALSYENPRSVGIKADYIKEKGLAGAMFWEYGADDETSSETAGRVAGDPALEHIVPGSDCAYPAYTRPLFEGRNRLRRNTKIFFQLALALHHHLTLVSIVMCWASVL